MLLPWAGRGAWAAPVNADATGVAMNKLPTLFVMISLSASPAWGSVREAAFASSADRPAAQTSMFAGATYRVGLDRRTSEARGRASLAFIGMTRTPTNDIKFRHGIELSQGQTGKPALYLAGQDLGQVKAKANLSSTATIGLVVVGVLAIGAVAAYYALRDPCDYKECE